MRLNLWSKSVVLSPPELITEREKPTKGELVASRKGLFGGRM